MKKHWRKSTSLMPILTRTLSLLGLSIFRFAVLSTFNSNSLHCSTWSSVSIISFFFLPLFLFSLHRSWVINCIFQNRPKDCSFQCIFHFVVSLLRLWDLLFSRRERKRKNITSKWKITSFYIDGFINDFLSFSVAREEPNEFIDDHLYIFHGFIFTGFCSAFGGVWWTGSLMEFLFSFQELLMVEI